ncbi:pyruvate kinase [Catalinimonas niigatensis]|uniref:pyruvate kinase n=1 Tax=Catalinimonas niigatensis TaxID=1397264 RepID=UPI002666B558|nr:pyruvate kinase [Catalinimonas niigatensis]WPP50221.1 pyruvate kinase [Catalinimonas niigatensis]
MESNIVFNKTKIVATVGPACNTKEMLIELVKSGVDVFRLNFSHGTHEGHKKVIHFIREINEELGTNICILQDLQGPKIRVNKIENDEVNIDAGQNLIITCKEDMIGTKERVSTSYENLATDVSIGDTILIDDGKIELRVNKVDGNHVHTTVIYGGPLKSRKGINLPDTQVSAPSLTEKDREDLEFGLENNVDWIALSFVRKADDIYNLKNLIQEKGKTIKVISKIEKPEAIRNIDEIIAATDGLMVARGDLGVEIAMEDVPMVQKMLVHKCNMASKPVIIATQMMESMIENPRPTRAETNDVANGVMDGADAIMLSAETASGKYPVQAVKSMVKTILAVEKSSDLVYDKLSHIDTSSPTFYNDHLVLTACKLSKQVDARAIIGMTKSGYTSFRLSGHRPKADIFIFTADRELLNEINLYWGLRGFYYDKMGSTDETFDDLEQLLKDKGHLHKGDVVINTASMPLHWEDRTNMLKIQIVK